MKFLNESDKELFEYQVKASGDSEDKFIHKRHSLIGSLKDFRKGEKSKSGWRHNRWRHLIGIKRFHRSTAGKKFHRKLGNFLAGRTFTTKSTSQTESYLEVHDLKISLSSLLTHALIEREYFMEVSEAANYELFLEELEQEVGRILNEGYKDEDFDFLIRLTETAEMVKSLADKSGKSVEDVEAHWEKAKELAKKEGKQEDEEGYWAYVVGITKKSLGI